MMVFLLFKIPVRLNLKICSTLYRQPPPKPLDSSYQHHSELIIVSSDILFFPRNGSRIGSKANSRIGSRATSPNRKSGTKIQKPKPAQPIRSSSRNSSRSGTPTINRTNAAKPNEQPNRLEPVSTGTDLSEEMSSLRLTGSKSQTSNLSSSSNGPIKKQNDGSNESTGQNGDARPPPSPEELETLSDVGGNPVSIFVDETKPQSERLIAIESLEPELLDETEIGRLLLGLQKCIQSEIDPALQQTAFETIGRVDNQIKNLDF